jgi:hypothetical protein
MLSTDIRLFACYQLSTDIQLFASWPLAVSCHLPGLALVHLYRYTEPLDDQNKPKETNFGAFGVVKGRIDTPQMGLAVNSTTAY